MTEDKNTKTNQAQSDKTKMSGWKITGIVVASLLFVVCLALDIWWLFIYFKAPEKAISYNFNIDLQETADGKLRKNFIEINYYTNKNKNGIPMFEIKFNSLMNEDKTNLVSKGYQYLLSDSNSTNTYFSPYSSLTGLLPKTDQIIKGEYVGARLFSTDYGWTRKIIQRFDLGTDMYRYDYTTDNASDISFISTNELNNDTFYRLQIGSGDDQKIIGMKFKAHHNELKDDDYLKGCEYVEDKIWNGNVAVVKVMADKHFIIPTDYITSIKVKDSYYIQYDINYLVNLLMESCLSLSYGTNTSIVFDFDNLFDYYECKDAEKGEYKEIPLEDEERLKIKKYISNYYSVNVFISEDGATKSSDSIFNLMYGSPNFKLSGSTADDSTIDNPNYSYGLSVIDVSLKDFDVVSNYGNYFILRLNDEFVEKYGDYKGVIALNIDIPYYEDWQSLYDFNIQEFDTRGFKIYDSTTFRKGVV